jgi:integrase
MGIVRANELLDDWSTWQLQNLGFSKRTVDRRHGSMRRWCRWLYPMPWTIAGPDLLEEWLRSFSNPATRRAYLSDAASLYQWASKRGIVKADITADIQRPKEPKRLPRPMPEADAAKAIHLSTDTRVRLALSLALYAGLRRAEICGLDADDINLGGDVPTITVRKGKGGKDRTIPIHPMLGADLVALAPTHGPIITRLDGRGRLSTAMLSALIAAHMEAVGSHHRLHGGRHRFGTQLAEVTGGDLQVVADLLGHESLTTTRGYTSLSGVRSAKAVMKMPGVA